MIRTLLEGFLKRPRFHATARLFLEAVVVVAVAASLHGCIHALPKSSPEQRLFCAAQAGDLGEVKEIVSSGVDVDAKSAWGFTALHFAVASESEDIAEFLIKQGADLDVLGGKLREGSIRVTPLDIAVGTRNKGLCFLLLKNGANPNPRGSGDSLPPFSDAIGAGLEATALMFIEKGVDVNMKSRNRCTPLHVAAAVGSTKVMMRLLEGGADVEAVTDFGFTPLHSAAKMGSMEGARILLNAGADPQATTHDGLTPADLAEQHGHSDLADLLRARAAQED